MLSSNQQVLLFIDGHAGQGETFLINAICYYLCSQSLIVLTTTTSAFAAQLYPEGRTTHSTYKVYFHHSAIFFIHKIICFLLQIPVNNNNELLKCDISQTVLVQI